MNQNQIIKFASFRIKTVLNFSIKTDEMKRIRFCFLLNYVIKLATSEMII